MPLPAVEAAPVQPAAKYAATHVSRWTGAAWVFTRGGGEAQLAPGGLLGGSQAGARFTYRLNDDPTRALALSARLYSPLNSTAGSEAALGIEWKPFAAIPVRLLAERRQRLGRSGRSAFSLMAAGGVSDQPVWDGISLDAYAQAGVVGAKSRDMFVDGSLRFSTIVSKGLGIGAGAWGAAQPGAARLDVGPQAVMRLPIGNSRLMLDWRFRIAGSAKPGSGPALTLATDF